MIFVVEKENCTACEECIAICPVGALAIKDGKAFIEQQKCLICGACWRECTEEAIKIVQSRLR